jgi:hypothetical protein
MNNLPAGRQVSEKKNEEIGIVHFISTSLIVEV